MPPETKGAAMQTIETIETIINDIAADTSEITSHELRAAADHCGMPPEIAEYLRGSADEMDRPVRLRDVLDDCRRVVTASAWLDDGTWAVRFTRVISEQQEDDELLVATDADLPVVEEAVHRSATERSYNIAGDVRFE
jgi:hypothetical protein